MHHVLATVALRFKLDMSVAGFERLTGTLRAKERESTVVRSGEITPEPNLLVCFEQLEIAL